MSDRRQVARRAHAAGDHVCVLFSGIQELVTVAADFLYDGLTRQHRCWYIASADEGAAVEHALLMLGVDTETEKARGALRILDGPTAYVVRGHFDPERTLAVFNDAIEDAWRSGFAGFRAAADMSWVLSVPDAEDLLVTYEALLRSLFETCRVTGMCLYDVDRMPLHVVNGALATHPILGTYGEYQPNPFYDAAVTRMPHDERSEMARRLRSARGDRAL